MEIKIITVGKIKESYFTDGIKEYMSRISKYCRITEIEVPDEKCPENLSDKEMIIVKEKEGERILSKIADTDYVITLEIEGKQLTSEELAKRLKSLDSTCSGSVAFVIGGSLGLADAVSRRSNFKLSFSKMTFPHQLMKVVLLEQIYRGLRCING